MDEGIEAQALGAGEYGNCQLVLRQSDGDPQTDVLVFAEDDSGAWPWERGNSPRGVRRWATAN